MNTPERFKDMQDKAVLDELKRTNISQTGVENMTFISDTKPIIEMPDTKPKETCRNGLDKDDPTLWHLMRDEQSYIHEHLETLRMLTIMTQPNSILEIGTGRGDSTLAFAEGLAHNGKGHLITLDIKTSNEALDTIQDEGLSQFVTFLRMSSQDYLKKLDGVNSIDMIFIDGLHTRKQVEMELHLLFPFITDEGMIILHDTNNPAHAGVREAVNRFFAEGNKWEDMIQYEYLHCNGLMILQNDRPDS